MFQLISPSLVDEPVDLIEISINQSQMSVPSAISVAAALLYLENAVFRESPVSQSPRGPYCMMGVCFECLVEIDGERNQRACQIEVYPGMQVVIESTTSSSIGAEEEL
ncbi:MAG: (2Fe-2S)-binding protein [Gammaproteobacteria bacterium]|nr:(2Fe-2S)-binding protein [Gammaproteobacteria bacterium]